MALVLWAGLLPVQAQSLFREEIWRGLTADNKAFRPGDALTVQVYENSSAVTSADTGTRRSNNLNAELAHGAVPVAQTQVRVAGDFDGGGRTQRASRLLTTVTVTVQEVLPGGQLRIAGTQSVTVNDELQRVTLEGLVRPIDISDGNVVQSTRIADARITYIGEGDLTDRQRRGWWRQLVDALGF
ncbi:MAG TPA: flagellar basal body L-ring protein FlgH [Ramlibacter sp.]|jgi:flagellar L-ring protein precursor FlgH|uniref:flagellar basal body L-ring protein FlgH n=1 Tax=Ramlibacter sp. TaxID=1917967 RepID=UPI002D46884E|nr:flagellar basal body L-ring protein FlgH [Ramlibacter sp.]HZY20752.1 flagellar basal body L-ring protein FlgH [Ramlibacter sp.]